MNPEAYIRDIRQLKDQAITDLEDLLTFAREMLSDTRFNRYIKAKTIIRLNTFSALYQRTDSLLALTRANQGNAANIIIRSMWETLAEYEFINLEKSNVNLEIRLAAESRQQLGAWREVQRLRSIYPNADTWQAIITDSDISRTIARREDELSKFGQSHLDIDLNSYKSLLSRLKSIDEVNLAKDSNHKNLKQFEYRSVYSLLSGDTHSTVLGNIDNSRIHPEGGREVRLDAPHYETVRAAHVAYKLMLSFLQTFNQHQKLRKGVEIRAFRTIDKGHDTQYEILQNRYGF